MSDFFQDKGGFKVRGFPVPDKAKGAPTPAPIGLTGAAQKNAKSSLRVAMEDFRVSYQNDPVGFVENVLGAKPLPWQAEFLEAVADPAKRRISVRAGHGVGKSTGCAWALIWHMMMRYPQKSVCTAPTSGQLFDALFSEVKFWIGKLPDVLRNSIEVLSDRIVLKAAPESSFISARTSVAEKPEALAGIHSENVLLIADEASAVPEPIFQSAAGSMSGEAATTILISNPTRNSGLFFRTHHELKDDWYAMHVTCLDNPLVTGDFIRDIAKTYGETSNVYRVRVLGEFALHEDDTLIAAELVDAAMVRDIAVDPASGLVYGLDVARFGDDRTVLCKRRGNVVLEFKSWSGADLMQTVGKVMNEAASDRPDVILVDSIGLGAGVSDRLRELSGTRNLDFDVRDVNVSESPAMAGSAAKLRDELWLQVRDWLTARACKLPKDDDLRQELVSPRYGFLSNGKIKVEGKKEMKRRGLRSPDMADALCLSFAGEVAGVGGRASGWIKGKALKRGIKGVI